MCAATTLPLFCFSLNLLSLYTEDPLRPPFRQRLSFRFTVAAITTAAVAAAVGAGASLDEPVARARVCVHSCACERVSVRVCVRACERVATCTSVLAPRSMSSAAMAWCPARTATCSGVKPS